MLAVVARDRPEQEQARVLFGKRLGARPPRPAIEPAPTHGPTWILVWAMVADGDPVVVLVATA